MTSFCLSNICTDHVIASEKTEVQVNEKFEDPESDIIEIVRSDRENSTGQQYPAGFDIQEDDVSPEFANDPLFKLLKQLSATGEQGAEMPTDFDPSSLFASLPGMGNIPTGDIPSQQTVDVSQNTLSTNLAWTLLHFFSHLFLAFYVGLHNSTDFIYGDESNIGDASEIISSRVFLYFATLQLILQSARFFFEAQIPPPPSMMISIVSMLPQPFSQYILTGLRYIRIAKTIVQDFCVLIFVAGIASYLR